MPVTVITGPPCSGKTTMARHLAGPGHIVIDFDDIARNLGSPRDWQHPYSIRVEAATEMGRRLARLAQVHDQVTAYVVRSAPDPVERAQLAAQLKATVWVLDPGQGECLRRAAADRRPRGTDASIREWYARYRPSSVDRPCPHHAVPARRHEPHPGMVG